MGLEDVDEIFSEVSEEVLALVSGIAIIITIIFFIYAVVPLYEDHSTIVLFSLLSLIVCFAGPVLFRLPEMSSVPEVVGWMMTGITIAGFAWIIFHVGNYIDLLGLKVIIPSGLLGFASSLPLTQGVLLPLLGEGMFEMFETDMEEDEFEEEEFEEDEFEEDEFESDLEEDFDEIDEVGDTFEEPVEEDTFEEPEEEEDEGPW